MKHAALLPLAAVAAAAIALTGCSSGGSSSQSAGSSPTATATAASAQTDYDPQPYDNLKDGGTYTTGSSFSGDDTQGLLWNVNASLTASRIWSWYNPVAITFSPEGDVQINHDYYTDATSQTVDGKQVVTITINPEAVYNDGTPIDWHSIESTWKVGNGSDPGYQIGSSSGYDQIESVVQGVDDRQAVVTFSTPYSGWPALFSRFINPEAATVDNFNNAYSNQVQPQWGAGPFTVESYDQNSKQIVFTRNPKWWGRTGKLEKRIFLDLETTQASVNAFKNGQIDSTSLGTPENISQAKDTEGAEIRQGGSPFEYSLFVNSKSELLSDVAVRHAVLAAVNRQEIANIEFQGLDYTEPLPGSALYYSFQKGYQDNVSKVLSYSTDEAGQILDEAGWTLGDDGIREKDGQKLEIGYTLFGDEPLEKAVAQSLAASEKKAGIQIDIQPTDNSEWSSTINQGKFDLVLSGNRSTDPYGSYSLSGFYGSTSESNMTGVGTPEIDAEIARVNAIADPDEQIAEANKVEEQALALYGMLPLYSGPSTYAVKKGLANVGATIFYSPLPEEIGWEKDS